MPPQPPAVTIQQIHDASGWYVVWGPTAGQTQSKQLVVFWALGTDGTTIEPIVSSQADGTLVQASSISTDYRLDHPQNYSRSAANPW